VSLQGGDDTLEKSAEVIVVEATRSRAKPIGIREQISLDAFGEKHRKRA
jgi:hypothetical protein